MFGALIGRIKRQNATLLTRLATRWTRFATFFAGFETLRTRHSGEWVVGGKAGLDGSWMDAGGNGVKYAGLWTGREGYFILQFITHVI